MEERSSTLRRLAAAVAAAGARRIAVDGADAAGKTTLADELLPLLAEQGVRAARVSVDDFLRPREERYRLGPESPDGYYRDSHDLAAFAARVAAERGPVIVDGVFLLRPELRDLWDYVVLVEVEHDEALRRGIERDGEEMRHRYLVRYLPAQRRYLETVAPARPPDAVLENTDPAAPTLRLR